MLFTAYCINVAFNNSKWGQSVSRATHGSRLVSQTTGPIEYGMLHIGEGDEIVVTWLEHHANIVP